MITLGTPEARWHDYADGARVRFAPITIKAVRAARRAVAAILKVDVDDLEEAGDELSRELLRRGIVEMEGFGDAEGNPIAADDAGITTFLSDPSAFEWADYVYVKPWADREREKNASAGSSHGTSVAAMPESNTASSAAPAGGDVKSAPTSRTSRKRKPAKPSSK